MLKWPNDLVVGDAKIAGLLAEIVTGGSGLAVVVGIGVNLTHEGPADILATSVLEQSGVTITPDALLDILLEELEVRRSRLDTAEGRVELRDEYHRALATIGQLVRVELLEGALIGVATSVDESGRLVLDVDGVMMTLSAGDVVHVRSHEGDGP
jgi:BirA family biotin operon repressor/biotin-[acetyl-CoA-carboxylase] ligase